MGRWIEPLLGVFYMLQYFEKAISPSVKAFDLLNKMRYILLVMALLKACDVINNSRHLVHHLGFYQELEISLRPREIAIFCTLHEK